jgi:hypothetical protein
MSTKKAGRFPIRGNEGPAKNLRLKRRKNAQQNTKTQCFLCWFLKFSRKRFLKLGGFSLPFAETNDEMSTKSDSLRVRKAILNNNLHATGEKSNPFSAFFSKFSTLRRKGQEGRIASTLRWGRLRRLGELVCTSLTDY